MAKAKRSIKFPSSGKYAIAFLLEIREGHEGPFTVAWIRSGLATSQRENASGLHAWLESAGIIDSGSGLTERGKALAAGPSSSRYRAAAVEALEDLAGAALLAELKSVSTYGEARDLLVRTFEVDPSSARKALAGIYVLASAAGNVELARRCQSGKEPQGISLIRPLERPAPELPSGDLQAVPERFRIFAGGTGGLDNLFGAVAAEPKLLDMLLGVGKQALSAAQMNQLMVLAHQAPMSPDFFDYYWCSVPESHQYDVTQIEGFKPSYASAIAIGSQDQLYWGLYRFYVDGLLHFGNVRTAYQVLRDLSMSQISHFFRERLADTDFLTARGPVLEIGSIPEDDRYLISEMACKTYQPQEIGKPGLAEMLKEALGAHKTTGTVAVRDLVGDNSYIEGKWPAYQSELKFSVDEFIENQVATADDIDRQVASIEPRFLRAREIAISNTKTYLSMVGDLDIYVATSMRSRQDFRDVTRLCERVFGSKELKAFNLRYFNPTLSAAENHEDKGLIECLMVERAKALLYISGISDSYGKDAEAAMALSMGKPVIFFCDLAHRERFSRDGHPLSRLVDFRTGVAIGAMVTSSQEQVVELLRRLFTNSMRYVLEQKPSATGTYLLLKEELTNSTVRLQTSDVLLRETFWNHYGGRRPRSSRSSQWASPTIEATRSAIA